MSVTHRLCVLLLCGLALFTAAASQAAGMKWRTPIPTHSETLISAVNAPSITITAQVIRDTDAKVLEKTIKTYIVTPFTEITVNGQRATIAQLKPGMKISVTMSTDPTHAARIVASG
jgi:hypothetical protein